MFHFSVCPYKVTRENLLALESALERTLSDRDFRRVRFWIECVLEYSVRKELSDLYLEYLSWIYGFVRISSIDTSKVDYEEGVEIQRKAFKALAY